MFSPAYKRYALVLLTSLYGVSLFDSALMSLLLQPIKEDLRLSDTQLGLLTGIAFGLLYATLGVPIARWADRGDRVTITSLAMGLGALVAMAFYFVTNFVQLLLLRIAGGASDAGCKPLTYSLLGDYFPERVERTRAMYAWWLAGPVAALIAWTSAGWVNERYGWRIAFFLAGLLGLLLTILVKWTLIEPRTQPGAARPNGLPAPVPPIKAVFTLLWRQASCRYLTIAIVLLFMVGRGALVWKAAFMIRNHGIGTAELGVWMGLIMGLGGIACVLLGRYIVSRWFAENERGQMRLAAGSLALGAPILLGFLLVPTKEQALGAMLLLNLVTGVFAASPYVMLQRLVPDEMRATVLMVVMLLANLIGMGVGPLIVGSVSDALTPRLGADGLRYAMMLGVIGWLCASYYFFEVARTIDGDLLNAAQYKAA